MSPPSGLVPHALPHLPQLSKSIATSVHLPPHASVPAGQEDEHLPASHSTVEPSVEGGQTKSQEPQWLTSVPSVAQTLPPHDDWPGAQIVDCVPCTLPPVEVTTAWHRMGKVVHSCATFWPMS